jgi:hypothetical protein
LPNIAGAIVEYAISFSGPEPADPATIGKAEFLAKGFTQAGLAVGDWTVVVQGLNEAGDSVAEGSASVTVTAGGTVAANVTLQAAISSGGEGSLDLTLDWTDTGITSVTSIVGRIAFEDEAETSIAWEFASGGTTASYSATLPSGTYLVSADLMAGSVLLASFSEAVHIYDNAPTVATATLGSGDFNASPSAPTGVAASGGAEAGFILVSWTDASKVETHFVVERKAEGEAEFSVAASSVRASSTSWKDLSSEAGIGYYYRVKAVNNFGSSAYAEAAATASWTQTESSNSITSFSFAHPSLYDVSAEILEGDNVISFTLPWLFRGFPLVVDFAATGMAVELSGGSFQTSGETAVDFSIPQTYRVWSTNETVKEYSVDAQFTATAISPPGTVSYFSGPVRGGIGAADGTGTEAQFYAPKGLWDDGTYVYVADSMNHAIRRIDKNTTAVDTFAGLCGTSGSDDGIGTGALFNEPACVTGLDGYLYVVDNNGVRRIDTANAAVTTIYPLTCYSGNLCSGITNDGTDLYLAQRTIDGTFQGVRRISVDGTTVTDIAGQAGSGTSDGTGASASFTLPSASSTRGKKRARRYSTSAISTV